MKTTICIYFGARNNLKQLQTRFYILQMMCIKNLNGLTDFIKITPKLKIHIFCILCSRIAENRFCSLRVPIVL